MPRRKLFTLLLFLSLLLLPLTLPAGERTTVLKVTDGDTLWLRVKGRRIKVRLLGIDTPEKYHSRKMERDCISCGVSEYFMKHLGKEASRHMKEFLKIKSKVIKNLPFPEQGSWGMI